MSNMTKDETAILIKLVSEEIIRYEKMIKYNNDYISKYPAQGVECKDRIRKHNTKLDKLRKILGKITE